MSLLTLTLSLLLPLASQSANILMYLTVSSRSHHSVWTPLSHGLARRGHQVTVVTDNPSTDPPPGLTEIVVASKEFSSFQENYSVFLLSDNNKGVWDSLHRVMQGGEALMKVHSDALQHPDLQTILHSDPDWDLVIASPLFNEVGVMLGDYFHAPTILYMPVNAEQFLSMSLGHPDNLAWSGPGAGSIIAMVRTFCVNLVYQLYIKQAYFVQPQYQELRKHVPNYTMLDYPALERNADFGFYFSSPHLGQVSPRLPNTANLGFMHCRLGQRLPDDLQSWLESAGPGGVIYMSMGSIFQLPDGVLDMFEQVFNRLKVKVIWKRKVASVSEHMYQSPWVPQQDLLAHPKVKLFISQVGMMSLQESIYHSVPILGLPLTYEQNMNAKIVKQKLIGTVLDYKEVNLESLEEAIKHLLEDQSVQENINKMAKTVKDSRTHPLEDAIWWSEYVMRHSGCNHLQSPHRHSAHLLYHNMDMWLWLVLQMVVAMVVIWLAVQYVKRVYRSI